MRVLGRDPVILRLSHGWKRLDQIKDVQSVPGPHLANKLVYRFELVITGKRVQFRNEQDMARQVPFRAKTGEFSEGGLGLNPARLSIFVEPIVIVPIVFVSAHVAERAVEIGGQPGKSV